MHCMKCGVGNSEGATFCISCGEKLATQPVPPSSPSAPIIGNAAAAAAAPAPAPISTSGSLDPGPPKPAMSDPELRSLKGVGGWLLFFCIALLIIRPVMDFASAGGDPAGLAIAFVLSALSITTGIMLLLEKPSAFIWLWWFFGVQAAVLALSIGVIVGGFGSEDLGVTGENGIREVVNVVRGIVSLIIWLAYFKRSKRVFATFGRNLW